MNRRRPNPWISIPSVGLGLLAGALGWTVTYLSCGSGGACVTWSVVIAIMSFLLVTMGTGLLLVLVYRSIAEWREAESQNQQTPDPGGETPET